ncbi:AAA family ATPase [Corynebacterium aquilae]|uniref:AAA family ATPase n=1 Tax=Corynebacterium aquilae TaxID=203263 RepID=UPI0009533235|nr:AAA family ATPase [Corynebacterium aquilae]
MAFATEEQIRDARRILVLGVPGAGKTTAAQRLAQLLGIRGVDFDTDIRWVDGESQPWTLRPLEDVQAGTRAIVADEQWVLAGISASVRELVYAHTDLIIYLDYADHVTLYRVLSRTIRRTLTKEKCCNGNVETVRKAFQPESILVWWWKARPKNRARAAQCLLDPALPPTVVCTRPRELEQIAQVLAARVEHTTRDIKTSR